MPKLPTREELFVLADDDQIHVVDASDLTKSKRMTALNIRNYMNTSDNIIDVNSEADLPTAVSGVITFGTAQDGNNYRSNTTLTTANRFVIEDGINIKFSSTSWDKTWNYTGVGTMFTSSDFAIFEVTSTVFNAPNGQMFDLSGPGSFIIDRFLSFDASIGGNLDCSFVSMQFVDFSGFGQGFTFAGDFAVSIVNGAFSFGRNEVSTMLTFEAPLLEVTMLSVGMTSDTNETMVNFDPSLIDNDASLTITANIFDDAAGGTILEAGSLDQKYIGSKFLGNKNVPDSTTSINIGFINNVEVTPLLQNVLTLIVGSFVSQLEERLAFQDVFSADNTTNILTSLNELAAPYTSGMANGDKVNLETTGTLPTGLITGIDYFVVTAVGSTFQLSLTAGGPAVAFTTNGTGILYFRHITGISRTGWVVYLGNEDVAIDVGGVLSLVKDGGGLKSYHTQAIKTDSSFSTTTDLDTYGKGGFVPVDNGRTQSSPLSTSTILSYNEGVKLGVINVENNDDIIVTDCSIVYSKG